MKAVVAVLLVLPITIMCLPECTTLTNASPGDHCEYCGPKKVECSTIKDGDGVFMVKHDFGYDQILTVCERKKKPPNNIPQICKISERTKEDLARIKRKNKLAKLSKISTDIHNIG